MWLFYYFNFERNYDILKLFWWTKIQTLIKTKWKISNEALERWTSGFPIVGEGGKGVVPHFHPAIFFETTPPPIKTDAPHLKMKPSTSVKQPLFHWKVKSPSRKWFQKKPQKNRKLSLILVSLSWNNTGKRLWKLHKNMIVKKYYITWLIAQFVVIDIAPLMVLFCNHQLFSNCLLPDL